MSPYPPDPVDATGPLRLVLTSFPSPEVADRIRRRVLEERLAACAWILPVDALYRWKGRLEGAREAAVLFKTLPKEVGALFRRLEELHPYEVPEIVELDVPRVSAGYLAWVHEVVEGGRPPFPLSAPGRRPLTRSGSRRARGARAPRGTRARRRHR